MSRGMLYNCTCEAERTHAVELVTRVDRSEEHGGAVDEGSGLTELEDGKALLIVEARLHDAQVVVKRHHLRQPNTHQTHYLMYGLGIPKRAYLVVQM